MTIIARFILFTFANVTGLLAAAHLVSGFIISSDLASLLSLATSLAIINLTLKPALKILLSPLIILTIGLFSLIINAGLLYLLDFLSPNLTINSLLDLCFVTIIMSITNLLTAWSAKKSY